MLPPGNWRKTGGASTFKMTVVEAPKRYPGATPILGSREVREAGDGRESLAAESNTTNAGPRRPDASNDREDGFAALDRIPRRHDRVPPE